MQSSMYNNDKEYQKFVSTLEEPKLSKNACTVLENRYLRRGPDNKPTETIKELFARVAWHLSRPELKYRSNKGAASFAYELYDAMIEGRIMFNSPTLFNAGTGNGLGLSACYVRVPEDSLDSIMQVCTDLALIQKAGGGVGYNFSKLRPKGSMVTTCAATTDGPLPFIDMYCSTTNAIQQGAKRRGAQMGMLDLCLGANTKIHTLNGKIAIKDLVGKKPYLYCTDGNGNLFIEQANKVWSNGIKKVIRVYFDNDNFIDCTPEHKFMLSDGSFREAKDLKTLDSLMAFNKQLDSRGYIRLGITGRYSNILEHRLVASSFLGALENLHVHHKDENKQNNDPNNLELLSKSEHAKLHYSDFIKSEQARITSERKGKKLEDWLGKEKAAQAKVNMSIGQSLRFNQEDVWNKGLTGELYLEHYTDGISNQYTPNHKVSKIIDLNEELEVFDIEMPVHHNFVAEEVFVHNCHPDVWQFIQAKADLTRWQNMNVSLLATNEWMNKLIANPNEYHKVYHEKWGEGYLVLDAATSQYHPVVWDKPVEELTKSESVLTIGQLFYEICRRAWTTGEPGLVFIDRVNEDWMFSVSGINPIEATNPCVIGSTLITTREGPKPIETLIGSSVDVWNGHDWTNVSPRITGYQKDVLKITFSDGSDLTCTLNHRFAIEGSSSLVEAKDLKVNNELKRFSYPIIEGNKELDPKDAYTRGVFSGDGSIHTETGKRSIWLYGKKKKLLRHLNKQSSNICGNDRTYVALQDKTWSKTFVPSVDYTTKTKLNWLSGLLDTDGSYNGAGSVSINSSDRDFLYQIKLMLMCIGTPSTLAMYKDKEDKMMPDGKGGQKIYTCQPSYRLSVSGYYVTKLMGLGLKPKLLKIPHKIESNRARAISIRNIENAGIADTVYCFTDPKMGLGLFNCAVTSQCGEQPLENGGNCTLASINLAKYYDSSLTTKLNTAKLREDIRLMQNALDNVVEVNTFPVDIVTKQNLKTRRIGGGIMGWADLLFLMGIPYDSQEARDLAKSIMSLIQDVSLEISEQLAVERGSFLDWEESDYTSPIRNAYRNTIAPTGTISIISDCSGGVEPIFSLAFTREVLQGANGRRVKMFEGNKIFETKLREFLDSKCSGEAKNLIEEFVKEIIKHAAINGTLKNYMGVPALWDGWKEFIAPFVTTKDIAPNDHVLMQAAWQTYVDTAISKTINLNNDATVEDVMEAYKLAYTSRCKGITVYRDGSRDGVAGMAQPMKLEKEEPKKEEPQVEVKEKSAFDDIKWETPTKSILVDDVSQALKVKQVTPMGNLHVTCVLDNTNLPVEIFAQISKAGEQPAADLEAICRLASMYLRETKNFDEVIKQLEHIGSSTLMPSKDGQIKSLPDGLSLALKKIKKALVNSSTQKIDTIKPVSTEKIHVVSTKNDTLYAQVCPVCTKKLVRAEGCLKCDDPVCGFSKC